MVCHIFPVDDTKNTKKLKRGILWKKIRGKTTSKMGRQNYGIIIKSIITLMYTVWHVDKYKITFKLVINWTNEIL